MPRMLGNLDELLERIDSSIQSEARETRQRKEKRIEEIMNRAEKQADNIVETALEKARMTADRKKSELQARRQRQEKARRLERRQAELDEIWRRAEEKLRELVNADDYHATLQALTIQAVHTLGPGRYQVAADERGHQLLTDARLSEWAQTIQENLGDNLTLTRTDQPADIWGGIILKDRSRPRQVDASFGNRLSIARDEIGDEVFDQIEST